jgi:hypothetical protein
MSQYKITGQGKDIKNITIPIRQRYSACVFGMVGFYATTK